MGGTGVGEGTGFGYPKFYDTEIFHERSFYFLSIFSQGAVTFL